jgi:hypothetical protein
MATADFNSNLNVEISRLSEFSFGLPGPGETPARAINQESAKPARSKGAQRSTAGEVILALVFLAAVVGSTFGINSKVLLQQFPQVASVLHLSAPANQAGVAEGVNGGIKVWVDRNTALYYCPGSAAYGRTRNGRFLNQAEARLENFEPAMRQECTAASMAMLRRDPAHR